MATTEAQKKATNKWQKENYEFIKVRLNKGEKEIIEELAKKENKSINQYIRERILKRMYGIRDKEAGNIIETGFASEKEANKRLEEFEGKDKKEGIYEADFYEVFKIEE